MRLLLDTHLLIWVGRDDAKLGSRARQHLAAAESLVFSAATIWEIAIKARLGKLDADARLVAEGAVHNGISELAVTSRHAGLVGSLPLHHNDPFDRLLVAQAIAEQLTLLTSDRALAAYGPHVVVV